APAFAAPAFSTTVFSAPAFAAAGSVFAAVVVPAVVAAAFASLRAGLGGFALFGAAVVVAALRVPFAAVRGLFCIGIRLAILRIRRITFGGGGCLLRGIGRGAAVGVFIARRSARPVRFFAGSAGACRSLGLRFQDLVDQVLLTQGRKPGEAHVAGEIFQFG